MARPRRGLRSTVALRLAALLCCAAAVSALLGTLSAGAWLSQPALGRAAAPLRATAAATAAPAAALAAAGAYFGQQRPVTSAAVLVGGSALAAAAVAVLARGAPRAAAAAGAPCLEDGATDPSLFVTTNVALGDKKAAFMQAASKAVAKCLSKPESYVAVCVQDSQDLIWGGSEAPCALCKVISLGSINLENNRALTQEVSALLAEFDVPQNRIYVNFFDMERQNVGYNGATFAG